MQATVLEYPQKQTLRMRFENTGTRDTGNNRKSAKAILPLHNSRKTQAMPQRNLDQVNSVKGYSCLLALVNASNRFGVSTKAETPYEI